MGLSELARKRNPENIGLPKRWQSKHGAYYYHVPESMKHKWDGKTLFRLGKTLPEAYKEWARRLEIIDQAKTVNELLDRYALEIIPDKAVKTQHENTRYLPKIRTYFGHMNIEDIEPHHIYRYLDERGRKKNGEGGPSIAKKEMLMLSHAYTKAVMWGYVKKHPFKGEVEYGGEKGRDRYVENWELDCFLSLKEKRKKDPTKMIQAYTNLKILTGLRKQDLLSMKVSQFTEVGIEVDLIKTGDEITIDWTPNLRAAVDYALSVRPFDIVPHVFCNRDGRSYYNSDKAYACSGFDSIWGRYMDRVIEDTDLEERFTEHDLRAKTASDLEDIAHAQKLLAHSSVEMTRKYIRKRQRVRPAR